jgi:hypothetical protein
MTVVAYEQLYRLNAGLDQALTSVDNLVRTGSFPKKQVSQFVDLIKETQAATNSFLVGIIEMDETTKAGKLFRRRRKRQRRDEQGSGQRWQLKCRKKPTRA